VVLKVLAYITRQHQVHTQLLVFDHHQMPEAGTQVPAGTVEEGEVIETALWREVEEEAGLLPAQLSLVRKLAEYESLEWGTLRHVFHLQAEVDYPIHGRKRYKARARMRGWCLIIIGLNLRQG
jgi:ADP-ribose pyrophosphatase YjhB (NUDIX family)